MRFGTVRGHRRRGKAAGHFAEDENPKADEEDQEHSAGQRAFVAAVDVKLSTADALRGLRFDRQAVLLGQLINLHEVDDGDMLLHELRHHAVDVQGSG